MLIFAYAYVWWTTIRLLSSSNIIILQFILLGYLLIVI